MIFGIIVGVLVIGALAYLGGVAIAVMVAAFGRRR